ncbi:MAG: cytochrome c oxidase subunit II [Gammaproteobacteria bacterium]|nr:cytochrome c oxidase subunit II [Gammaproteobacteria bacterium]
MTPRGPWCRSVAGLAAAAAAALAAGCGGAPFNTLTGGGPEARLLATLGWWLIALVSLTIVVMGVLIVWGALRRRGSLTEHLPIDADGGKGWILIGGVAVPVVVLSVLFFVTLGTLRALPGTVADPAVELEVTAHQWWWEIDYGGRPSERFSVANEIHVPVGEKIQVRLTSADVIHSFWVPRLFGKLDAIPGHTNHLVFEAERPGVYRGECAEYCGVQHSNMRLLVVAHEPAEFRSWVEHQRQPAAMPSDPELISGRNAFEQYACALCHTIRGTQARGGVAPDLTHFASRRTLGAGTFPNTRARLQAWIVNAQGMKPGIKMPKLAQFDGRTLNALAAYLESLE